MSWLSDAWHGVENIGQDIGQAAGSFWEHNKSWLPYAGAAVGAALIGPAAFAALGPEVAAGAGLAGAEAAGTIGGGEAAALAAGGIGAGEAAAGGAGLEAALTAGGGEAAGLAGGEAAAEGFAAGTGTEALLGGAGTDALGGAASTNILGSGAAAAAPTASGVDEAGFIAAADTLGGGAGSDVLAGGATTASAAPDIGASSIAVPGEATAAGGASFTDKIGAALGSPIVRYGVPLGALGYNILKGPDKLPSTAQQGIGIAGQEAAFGANELSLAQSGQVLPAQQAAIDQWLEKQKNEIYQRYASRGVTDPRSSSDYAGEIANAEAQAVAQRNTIINQMITTGLNAEGTASQSLMNAAQLQIAQDTAFNQSVSSAMTSFGLIAAFSGGRGGGGGGTAATTG